HLITGLIPHRTLKLVQPERIAPALHGGRSQWRDELQNRAVSHSAISTRRGCLGCVETSPYDSTFAAPGWASRRYGVLVRVRGLPTAIRTDGILRRFGHRRGLIRTNWQRLRLRPGGCG